MSINKSPGLLWGIPFCSGLLFTLSTPWAAVGLFLFWQPKNFVRACIAFFSALALLSHFYDFPVSGTQVEGTFKIHSLTESHRFASGWLYKGVLKTEKGRILCSCFSPHLYSPNDTYTIMGTVKAQRGTSYTLKTKGLWQAKSKTWSLALVRYQSKHFVKQYINKHIVQERAAAFLSGIVTGELEDRVMFAEFGKLGLSHIMAISGFHFGLLTLALHLLFRMVLPHKVEVICLMGLLTLYFLFVGDSPSVLRAWIIAMLALLGLLLKRRTKPANTLGSALLISCLLEPLSVTTLSFQLSYLATAGILLVYSPLSRLFELWIPKVPLSFAIEKPLLWQLGYIASCWMRNGLCLTMAVHLTILPLLLYTFHSFPLSSFLYNLFFPFLVSIGVMLFLLSLLVGGWLHFLTGLYCEWMLQIPQSPPLILKTLYTQNIPEAVVALSLLLIGWITLQGTWPHIRLRQKLMMRE